ncbi:zinc finger protein PLAGL1-like [Centruroides vittatus]|uniref:zinc finger protein PLAGL1-like n=1 Tax=Centruroides sculpturatus TaxID=218467 RepID=UPI000C6DF619|nr:zinc finger protein PLAGL1-like [Centruroides sculpturatus]XP_023233924.1 zinc finger protein PLAGL1-like [Centruroides sculpturatus]XP_023233925.1 zinc finger protein PLAGL1-like [Centruroides sculpturatus]
MRDSDDECTATCGDARIPTIAHCSRVVTSGRNTQRGLLGHQTLVDNGDIEKQFCCSEPSCGRSFTSKFKLMRHALIHTGERRFKCSVCERCFHRKDHLKNHLQIHNPNKALHSCNQCSKKYSSLLSFRKHLAFHAAEAGDLSCKLCGKIFAAQEDIMYHLKVHSGSRALKGPSERKFKCDQCDRSFFTRKDVKRHMVVHTGVRNFLCQLCPQRFGRKDHLVRHIKKSHGAHQVISHQGSPLKVEATTESRGPLCPDNGDKSSPMSAPLSLPDVTSNVPQSPCSLPPMSLMQDANYGAMKQESCFTTSSDGLLSGGNSGSIGTDDNDGLLRLGEITPSLMPISQYLPLNTSFNTSLPHLIPPNCYLTTMPGSSNLLPGLATDGVLPSITSNAIPSFSPPVSLDMGNPSLPHFSQAFQ